MVHLKANKTLEEIIIKETTRLIGSYPNEEVSEEFIKEIEDRSLSFEHMVECCMYPTCILLGRYKAFEYVSFGQHKNNKDVVTVGIAVWPATYRQ